MMPQNPRRRKRVSVAKAGGVDEVQGDEGEGEGLLEAYKNEMRLRDIRTTPFSFGGEDRCCCGGVAEFIREALGLRKPFAFIASLRGFLRHDEKTG